MGTQIERKFLVDVQKFLAGADNLPRALLHQGYLSSEPAVRVRTEGRANGFGQDTIAAVITDARLTIKGNGLLSRAEFEYIIPTEDATQLLGLAKSSISKFRYKINHGWSTWEVDQFLEAHDGLWLAEIELRTEDQPFQRPDWLLDEVTADRRYQNVYLAEHPERFWAAGRCSAAPCRSARNPSSSGPAGRGKSSPPSRR